MTLRQQWVVASMIILLLTSGVALLLPPTLWLYTLGVLGGAGWAHALHMALQS